MTDELYKNTLKKMFVDSGEYSFENENKAKRFVNKVFNIAESRYSSEGFYHKYDEFQEFLYTSEVDGIAYFVFQGEYGDY